MAASEGGRKNELKRRNQARAARMKALGIERTTGRCALCYRIIAVDSAKSRYRHRCNH